MCIGHCTNVSWIIFFQAHMKHFQTLTYTMLHVNYISVKLKEEIDHMFARKVNLNQLLKIENIQSTFSMQLD